MKRLTITRRIAQTESDKKDRFFFSGKRKRKVKLLGRRISGTKKAYKHTLLRRVAFLIQEVFHLF